VSAGSGSPEAGTDLARAERSLRLRREGGLTFKGARAALSWFFPARLRMQSANNLHPRGEIAPGGEVVFVEVDGGRGGDIDDVLVTISTIGAVLHELEVHHPVEHRMLVARYQDGKSQADIADLVGQSQSSVSAVLGRAEWYCLALLRWAGVVR
jgi:hypothetical protein